MKHRSIVIILCILAPIVYLVCALATNTLLPVQQREMPPAAGQIEQEAFERMKADVLNNLPATPKLPDATATPEPLPEMTLETPSNYDAVKDEISAKSKEIADNVNKTQQTINNRLEEWKLPDLEAEDLPTQDAPEVPSLGSVKSEPMPALPSFAEIAAMLPDITLPDLSEVLPKLEMVEIPSISLPIESYPTLAPLPELVVPELPKYEFNIPESFWNMLVPQS